MSIKFSNNEDTSAKATATDINSIKTNINIENKNKVFQFAESWRVGKGLRINWEVIVKFVNPIE